MTPARKILMLLLFLGLAGNIGGSGTLASFNASTTNGGSSFASGTIVLSNQKNVATACLSAVTNTNTNSNACDVAFNTTLAKPGTTATVDLTLENKGSLPGTLRLYAPGVCSSADDAGAYHGSGNLCDAVQMVVQRYSSLANRNSSNTSGGTCVYSLSGANPCVLDATRTLTHFASTHNSAVNGISLGTLIGNDGGTSDADTAFVRITLTFPNGTPANDNQFQGRIASWGYTWLLEQN